MKNFKEFIESTLNEAKTMDLESYKKDVQYELGKNNTNLIDDDQLFYDHMIDCFTKGISPKECVAEYLN